MDLIRCALGSCSVSQFTEDRVFARCPCLTARYCSKEHQRSDWKSHRALCERARATAKEGNSTPSGIVGRPNLTATQLAELIRQFKWAFA
jgi:hypothetical protein